MSSTACKTLGATVVASSKTANTTASLANCEHLNKRTRIELLAAENDHNYTASRASEPANEHNRAQEPETNNNGPNSNGRMDDCTAAMVLMFLSCRPTGEQAPPTDGVKIASTKPASPEHAGYIREEAQPAIVLNDREDGGLKESNCQQQQTASTASVGPLVMNKRGRNSEPIEMLASNGRAPLDTRKHFKRQNGHSIREVNAVVQADEAALEVEHFDETSQGCRRQRRRPGRLLLSQQSECDDEELDLDDELKIKSSTIGETRHQSEHLDHEMIFELQQVDQVELNFSSDVEKFGGKSSSWSSSSLNDSQSVESVCNNNLNCAPGVKMPPTPPPMPANVKIDCVEWIKLRNLNRTCVKFDAQMKSEFGSVVNETIEATNEQQQLDKVVISFHKQQQEQEQEQQQQHHKQLERDFEQPVKMRTIFSCMWPSCPQNCDSLDDIERHVRAHLGPNSMGDEDFYYEETEVEEPTYLAIFSNQQREEERAALADGLEHSATGGAAAVVNAYAMNQSSHEMHLSHMALEAYETTNQHHHHHHHHHRNHNHHHHRHQRHRENQHDHHNLNFNHHQMMSQRQRQTKLVPLSPSHNSDGLSSGHSFASSSPATSPVCSTDSSLASTNASSASSCSSASSVGSSASSLSSTTSGFHLATAATSSAPLKSTPGGNARRSLDWSSHFLELDQGRSPAQQTAKWSTSKARRSTSTAAATAAAAMSSSLSGQKQQGKRATKAQLVQEQLRASIIEQLRLNKQTGATPKTSLQFSMQLTSSSPHLNASGALSSQAHAKRQQLDHSYQQTGGGGGHLAAIKSRRGRRPSAKLAEASEFEGELARKRMASTTSDKLGKSKPQLFQQQQQPVCASHVEARTTDLSYQKQQQQRQLFAASAKAALLAPTPPLSSDHESLDGQRDCEQQPASAELMDTIWPTSSARSNSLSSGSDITGAPNQRPILSTLGKKRLGIRENRKCRKVYGMERRDQWCTQCKWKKACSRFAVDLQQQTPSQSQSHSHSLVSQQQFLMTPQ